MSREVMDNQAVLHRYTRRTYLLGVGDGYILGMQTAASLLENTVDGPRAVRESAQMLTAAVDSFLPGASRPDIQPKPRRSGSV